MTGQELFNKAIDMLGYAPSNNANGTDVLMRRAMTFIEALYADAYYALHGKQADLPELCNMQQPIPLPAYVLQDVLPYGLAMYLAQSESDADNQQLFTILYNQKRAGLTYTAKVQDALPITEG